MLSRINSSYQVQILRQVRVLQTAGILSLPQLSLGLLKWKADSNNNMLISYDDINSDVSNTNNHIKLVFDVKYVINDENFPNSSFLAKQYIQGMKRFVEKLLTMKKEKEKEKQSFLSKQHQNQDKSNKKSRKIYSSDIMSWIDQYLSSPNKNQYQRQKYKLIDQVIKVFTNLVKKRSETNQKLKQFYQQNTQDYYSSLAFVNHRKDIYDYHNYILTKQNNELKYYINLVNQFIDNTHDSFIQSTVFAFQPNIKELSFIINPLILALLTNVWSQVKYQQKKKNIENKDKTVFKHTSTNSNFFQKILYIDFSGDQCPYTIDILRSLYKYIMYVSFPKNFNNYEFEIDNQMSVAMSEQNNYNYGFERKHDKQIKKMIDNQRQMKKTLFNEQKAKARAKIILSKQQDTKKQLHKKYMQDLFERGGNSENNNNIYIYPIKSSGLIANNQQIEQTYFEAMYYESNYVYSIIKNVILKNAQAFNPSIVLINYNGNIHIQNHHFLDMMKSLAVLTDSRMMLFPCMNKIFFDPNTNMNENTDYPEVQNFLFEPYKVHEQHYLNLKKNVDLFQKIQIFHTVASGKTNLSPISNYEPQLQKYKNILIKPYIAHITNVNSSSNDNIKSSSQNPKRSLILASTLFLSNKYSQYKNFFPQNCFINKLYERISTLLKSQMKQQQPELQQQISYFKSKYVKNIQETQKEQQIQKALNTFKNLLYIESLIKKVRRVIYIKTSWNQYDFNSKYDNVLPVTFFTKQNDREVDIYLTNQSQILYYNKENQFNNKQHVIVVYIMNHLYRKKQWKNYYGFVKCVSHKSNTELKIQKVQLHEFKLQTKDQNEFVLYSRWNYHETKNYSLLYWPIKFNFIKQGLAHLNKRIYYGSQTLCSKIYLSYKTNPFSFYELKYEQKCSPQTRCNAFSNQNNNKQEIYIFGGQSFDSTNYVANTSKIVKLNIDTSKIKQQSKSIKIQVKQYQKEIDSFIPFMAEIDVIKKYKKNDQQVYLIGGYGTQFGSFFQPLSGYFYKLNKIQQKVPITQIDILALIQKQNKEQKKQKSVFFKQDFHYRPINIRQPLRLRQTIYSTCVIRKYLDNYILQQNIPCQQTGYIIRNYLHYPVPTKYKNENENQMLNSYEQYSFVDPSYYEYSEQYKLFLSTFQQTANSTSITDVKVNCLDNYMLAQQRNEKIYTQYDYIFLPSTQLIKKRRQKNQRVKDNQHDLIEKVISVATNNSHVVILFKHPRITQNSFTIAYSDLTHYSLNKQKRQAKFQQVQRFQQQNNVLEYIVNILKNDLIVLTKIWETYFEIHVLMLKGNNKKLRFVKSFPDQNNRNLKFKVATHTVNNIVLYILYSIQSSSINMQIFKSELNLTNLIYYSYNQSQNLINAPSIIKFSSIHQKVIQLQNKPNENEKLQIIFGQIRQQCLSKKSSFTIYCNIGKEKIDIEFQQLNKN